MEEIDINNLVELTHGDTFTSELFINEGSEVCPIQYELKDEDKVYFALMRPNQPFEMAVVRKIFDVNNINEESGNVVIALDSKDTECLCPGRYEYCIKIQLANGEINTLIQNTLFTLY